jgi:hypothetical protein
MNKETIQQWLMLSELSKQNIFQEVAIKMNLPPAAVEKIGG